MQRPGGHRHRCSALIEKAHVSPKFWRTNLHRPEWQLLHGAGLVRLALPKLRAEGSNPFRSTFFVATT